MSDNLEIYNAVRAVPKTAQKPIGAGRLKGMTDINPMWRIEELTRLFGPVGIGWYYEIVNKWIEGGAGDERCAFVDIRLYIKQDGEWSKPIEGTGGSMLVAQERSGLHTSDEAYKMALTDAISVACKALGMGADIYWAAGRTKYNNGAKQQDVPYPDASGGGKVNANDLYMVNQVMSVYPKDSRAGALTAALAKYKAAKPEELTKEQFVKFRNELLDSAKEVMSKRLDSMITSFAKKAGMSEDNARGMIETALGTSFEDVSFATFGTFSKRFLQMYNDLDTNEQAGV